jgi:hypothetical protein
MHVSSRRLGALLLVAGLAACSNKTISTQLGMDKQAPDEFQVVGRAPLVLPPDYKLRPPRPGAVRPQEQSTREQARAVLTGTPVDQSPTATTATAVATSPGQQALLAEANAIDANPDIRRTVNEETAALLEVDDSNWLFVLSWQRSRMQPQAEVLDAQAEARRLGARRAAEQVAIDTVSATPGTVRRSQTTIGSTIEQDG